MHSIKLGGQRQEQVLPNQVLVRISRTSVRNLTNDLSKPANMTI